MKKYVMGRYVEEKALDRAMEAAYEALPERDQFVIEAAIDDVVSPTRHSGQRTLPRGFGESSVWEVLSKLGLFLAENPDVQARFDESGRFESLVRVKPTGHGEKQIRSFLL